MARSVWKGPFVDPKLLKKVRKAQEESAAKEKKTITLMVCPVLRSSRKSFLMMVRTDWKNGVTI